MMYKKFKRLLKELGCYSAFIYNFKKLDRYLSDLCSVDKPIQYFITASMKRRPFEKNSYFYYFINDAFDWHRTKEGFDYWCKISHDIIKKAKEYKYI